MDQEINYVLGLKLINSLLECNDRFSHKEHLNLLYNKYLLLQLNPDYTIVERNNILDQMKQIWISVPSDLIKNDDFMLSTQRFRHLLEK